jgi:hypothetical protein
MGADAAGAGQQEGIRDVGGFHDLFKIGGGNQLGVIEKLPFFVHTKLTFQPEILRK